MAMTMLAVILGAGTAAVTRGLKERAAVRARTPACRVDSDFTKDPDSSPASQDVSLCSRQPGR